VQTQPGASRRRRPVRIVHALTAGVAVLALAGCSAPDNAFTRLGMPEPITDRATHTLFLWRAAWIAALVVGIFVWTLIIGSVIRYRARGDNPAHQLRYHLPVEILYTFVPFVIVGVMFFYTVREQNVVTNVDRTQPPAHVVQVVGSQWQWTFNYRDEKSVGETVYDMGTPTALPELWLVQNQKTGIHLASPDVNHSFWIPDFLYKLDVIPGRDNYFEMTPTKLGTYKGRCAELCGLYHSRMLFTLKVVSAADFEAHLNQLKTNGHTGEATGPAIPQPAASGQEKR
jgi:cytochrome c oxidase subunit 2